MSPSEDESNEVVAHKELANELVDAAWPPRKEPFVLRFDVIVGGIGGVCRVA